MNREELLGSYVKVIALFAVLFLLYSELFVGTQSHASYITFLVEFSSQILHTIGFGLYGAYTTKNTPYWREYGGGQDKEFPSETVKINQWNHLTLSYDKANRIQKGYHNGTQVMSQGDCNSSWYIYSRPRLISQSIPAL